MSSLVFAATSGDVKPKHNSRCVIDPEPLPCCHSPCFSSASGKARALRVFVESLVTRLKFPHNLLPEVKYRLRWLVSSEQIECQSGSCLDRVATFANICVSRQKDVECRLKIEYLFFRGTHPRFCTLTKSLTSLLIMT